MNEEWTDSVSPFYACSSFSVGFRDTEADRSALGRRRYYVLGTSLADGKGYRLLNEPGEIEAIQYPPGLPALVAIHEMILGSNDPAIVGVWMRRSWLLMSLLYISSVFLLSRIFLPRSYAMLLALTCLLNYQMCFLSTLLFRGTSVRSHFHPFRISLLQTETRVYLPDWCWLGGSRIVSAANNRCCATHSVGSDAALRRNIGKRVFARQLQLSRSFYGILISTRLSRRNIMSGPTTLISVPHPCSTT